MTAEQRRTKLQTQCDEKKNRKKERKEKVRLKTKKTRGIYKKKNQELKPE